MILDNLKNRGLISPPDFLIPNTHYLTIMGSEAYGVSNDSSEADEFLQAVAPHGMHA